MSDMSYASPAELLVVHDLRVRGFADSADVAVATGLEIDAVGAHLADLEAAGLARYRDGRVSGWMLTSDGRTHGEELVAAELDGTGLRDEVDAAYRRFLDVNQAFLSLCTDWQMRPDPEDPGAEPVVNDHTDLVYDGMVIDRLGETDAAVQPVCATLAGVLGRFGDYGDRLARALDRVRSGDLDWFTRPMIDSYHTVWFELHENLLATLGIERAREHAAG